MVGISGHQSGIKVGIKVGTIGKALIMEKSRKRRRINRWKKKKGASVCRRRLAGANWVIHFPGSCWNGKWQCRRRWRAATKVPPPLFVVVRSELELKVLCAPREEERLAGLFPLLFSSFLFLSFIRSFGLGHLLITLGPLEPLGKAITWMDVIALLQFFFEPFFFFSRSFFSLASQFVGRPIFQITSASADGVPEQEYQNIAVFWLSVCYI
jgi:hypothetical protein